MVDLLPLFPYPLFKIDTKPEFDDIRDDLIDFCYLEKEKDSKGLKNSNVDGWHSPILLHQERFIKYRDFMQKYIINSVGSYIGPETSIGFDGSWININGKNSSNVDHNHPKCNLAGCLWIKANENSGEIKLRNPNCFLHYNLLEVLDKETKENLFLKNTHKIKPTEGTMIIFPADLMHSVSSNSNDDEEDRISIAFNLSVNINVN
tara:strand:+ start:552 stop:1166 length:615 start_codon:yes stop_codon:yes gene_type:complete